MSTELQKAEDFLKQVNLPDRHSYFQLRYFVIGKEPTMQGKMWQCLREIRSRKDALENIVWEEEELKDNKELSEIQIKKIERATELAVDELDVKEGDIQIRKIKRQLKSTEKKAEELVRRKKNTEEELNFFVQSLETLMKTENLKSYDDLEAQTEYWGAKLSQKLNLGNLLGGKLDVELVDTVLALPDTSPIKKEVVYMIENIQNRLLEEKADSEAMLRTSKEAEKNAKALTED